ncbi:calcium-binding protein [Pseudomonas sp. F(2018)]|uniref:calcium-binding protein n=1 Tax=Pseudomonas sp. F(2018) TaxID=2502240 RepID=UPI00273F2E61|nr:hypothetical protein [Pseudomonas sp. F(2018)]
MPTDSSMGWTFYGLVEDGLRDSNGYKYMDPAAYGFSPGELVEGHLALSGAALLAYLAALDGAGRGTLTLDASAGVDFSLPVPRVGGLDEADFTPWAAPTLTLTSQGLDVPLADAQAFLFSQDDPDGPNFWMDQADVGGFFFRDDDDKQMFLYGAWVPDGQLVDQVIGGDSNDTLMGDDELPLLYGRGGDDSLLLQAAGYAWGGFGADHLTGSNGRDWLRGGYDNDVISGGGGDDELHGEGGADRISGGSGNDAIHGDSQRVGGYDVLSGNAGDDRLYGGWGNDILRGGEGADYLEGGSGEDAADYGAAASGVRVQLGLLSALVDDSEADGDVLVGIEYLSGSEHADTLGGDGGDNRLVGRDGDDDLYGGAGADRLYGGDGDDVLDGGIAAGGVADGRDLLTGGAGGDRFEFTMDLRLSGPGDAAQDYERQSFDLDSVLDFNPQEDLLVFVGQRSSFDSLRIADYQSSAGNSGTLITLDSQSRVFLLGVVADQLNDANMQFVSA